MVSLSAAVLAGYERVSLYNSPFAAHERGCAIDLYPESGSETVRSPVAGEVLEVRTVTAPPQPYAETDDHLLLVDCGAHVARLLHVDPIVEPGDPIAVGDPLGRLVRAGFFAPWVDNHLHLGFRGLDANPYRASGSLPISLGIDPEALAWDGSGVVAERGATYAILDAPARSPTNAFAGIGASFLPTDPDIEDRSGAAGSNGVSSNRIPVVLDGGLAHYAGGGAYGGSGPGRIDFLGTEIGVARGRNVAWHPLTVSANGRPITGLSLVCGQGGVGAKLICPNVAFEPGERVSVSIDRDD